MKYEDIKFFSERCEEHPDHQTGMVSHQMIQDRLSEEVDELRAYIESQLAQPEQEPVAFASHGVINWIADKQFQHEADLYTTPPQPKQEPVGYVSEGEPDRLIAQKQTKTPLRNYRLFTHDVPLYTTPHTKVGCVECRVSGGHAFYCVACAKNLFGGYKK